MPYYIQSLNLKKLNSYQIDDESLLKGLWSQLGATLHNI